MPGSRDMLYHFSKFKLAKLLDGFILSIQKLMRIARQQNFFNGRKVDLAIDEHELPYYGKEQPMLCRDNRLHGTSFCFKFITLAVVEHEIEGAKLRFMICHKNGEKFAFATNLKASGIRRAELLFQLYGKRWGIETGYRVLEQDFRARTFSPNYTVRLFYFLFGLALYNCWVLVTLTPPQFRE
jgi:hypothetical protein